MKEKAKNSKNEGELEQTIKDMVQLRIPEMLEVEREG